MENKNPSDLNPSPEITDAANPAQKEQNLTKEPMSRSRFLKLGLGGVTVALFTACKEKTITPDKPIDPIDRTTDNPAHFKDFENTIKKKQLTTEGGITFGEQNFKIHWNGKEYVLEIKPSLLVDPCITQLEADAKKFGHDVTKCYVFYSFRNNGDLRRSWGIPYNVLVANKGKSLDLNSEDYNKYLTNSSLAQGHPATTYVKRDERGYLSIGTSAPDWSDMSRMLIIDPYFIGK